MPSFAIILTTHKRPDLVVRAVQSVSAQYYEDWRLILVNDSPHVNYGDVEALIQQEGRTSYLRNDTNIGKNGSVNRALDFLREEGFSGYVVFLDDDDWLSPSCLADFAHRIKERPNAGWLVSARGRTDGSFFTRNHTRRHLIQYHLDVLVLKRFSGDATHCIRFTEASKCRFLETVKNAEEWFFFSQLARRTPLFIYIPTIGTYSEGYLGGGLTRSTLSRGEKICLYRRIFNELSRVRAWNAYIALYMMLRLGKLLTPS